MMAIAINIKIIKFIFSKLLKKEAMFRSEFSNKEIIIPINIVTVSLLTIFGLPALFSLIIILIVVF